MPRFLLAICGLLLAVPCAASPSFESLREVSLPQVVDRGQLGDRTLVRTPTQLILVDWSRPRGLRDSVIADTPLATRGARSRFIPWGGAVVAMAPEGQARHMVIHHEPGGPLAVGVVDDADWSASNRLVDGVPYFQDWDGSEVDLVPAWGHDGPAWKIPCAFGLVPRITKCTGDRIVAVDDDYQGYDGGAFQLWDITDPDAPHRGPVIETLLPATDAVIQDHILYLGAGSLQTWDISDVDAPVLLDTLGPNGRHDRMVVRGDRLASWRDQNYVRIINVADPTDLRVAMSHSPYGYPSYFMGLLSLEDERVVVSDRVSLRSLDLPTAGGGAITDGGTSWPMIGDHAATDGYRLWIQGEGRLVADTGRGLLTGVEEAVLPLNHLAGTCPVFLLHHRGHLLYAPGDGRFFVEDVSDPYQGVTVFALDEEVKVHDLELRGDVLALRSDRMVLLLDVSEPASPRILGSVSLGPCTWYRMTLLDGLLVVTHTWYQDMGGYENELRVYDLSAGGACPEVGRYVFGGDGDYITDTAGIGSELYVYIVVWGPVFNSNAEIRFDLTDPSVPVLAESRDPGNVIRDVTFHTVDAAASLFLVEIDESQLRLAPYEGALPPAEPPVATTELAQSLTVVAAAAHRVFLTNPGAVVSYRIEGLDLSSAPAPPATARMRAVPNPFNARVDFQVDSTTAGRVEAEVFDLRGHRLRTLSARRPAGPATLTWDGRDDAGRDVPSGFYLVRVTTPDGAVSFGRCALVR